MLYDLCRDGHAAEHTVEIEIPPASQEKRLSTIFVPVRKFTSLHVVENVVASVDSIIPCVPHVLEYAVAGDFLEMVYVIAVLHGHSHHIKSAFITSEGKFVEEETHLRLCLQIAAFHVLVEILVAQVVVYPCNGVGRVLNEEFVAAGNRREKCGARQNCSYYVFHVLLQIKVDTDAECS